MNEMEYIPMEHDFRFSLEVKYKVPFRNNVAVLTILTLLVYIAVVAGSNGAATDGFLRLTGKVRIKVAYFNAALALSFLSLYIKVYGVYVRKNIHYLKDADFGFIIKERMMITKVFDTPSGINIYWLSSDAIKTFVPDPYRRFREGDQLFIYYLKFSKEYLGYEC